jgi:hypothetical protein
MRQRAARAPGPGPVPREIPIEQLPDIRYNLEVNGVDGETTFRISTSNPRTVLAFLMAHDHEGSAPELVVHQIQKKTMLARGVDDNRTVLTLSNEYVWQFLRMAGGGETGFRMAKQAADEMLKKKDEVEHELSTEGVEVPAEPPVATGDVEAVGAGSDRPWEQPHGVGGGVHREPPAAAGGRPEPDGETS